MFKREVKCALPNHQSKQSRTLALLLLSATAGSTDAIGFLGLNGLFTAHITGNIVILAGHLVAQGRAGIAQMISVPVFMMVLGLARLIGLALDRYGSGVAGRALLMLQFALLLGFFLLCFPLGRTFDTNAPWVTFAGMWGVAAMAVQNVLVQVSIPGAPSTAVLTTNITRFTVAAVESVAGQGMNRRAAHEKVAATFPPIVGFGRRLSRMANRPVCSAAAGFAQPRRIAGQRPQPRMSLGCRMAETATPRLSYQVIRFPRLAAEDDAASLDQAVKCVGRPIDHLTARQVQVVQPILQPSKFSL